MRSVSSRLFRPRSIVDIFRTVLLSLTVLWLFNLVQYPLQLFSSPREPAFRPADTPSPSGNLRCRDLPGANETVVIIKTGVTEFEHKLPVHIETTLKCYPHYLIYSDHQEFFKGEQIIDSLEPISEDIKEGHADFDFYRRVRANGRKALDQNELSNKAGFNRHPSNEDKMNMGGWRLDKWKFLPMFNHTYHAYPNMKWYVFIEADTYMFWSNMLKYQAALDHTKPVYAGAELFIDWTFFAHGGGGTLLSRPAMELFVEEYTAHYEQWESFVDMHWAGDIVLGRVLNSGGVTLTPAWPHFHPHAPGNDTFWWADDDRRFWCYPAISYHHVTPEVVSDLWHFEQSWIEREQEQVAFARKAGKNQAPLTPVQTGQQAMKRRDIFINYLMTKMEHPASEWDNNSVEERGIVSSKEACQAICEEEKRCVQWRYDFTTGKCNVNDEPRWGDQAPRTGYYSGWLHDRIRTYVDELIPCGNEGWILK